ncbi:helix-turn-helix domain-containing protein [Halorubrum sp. Atlit-8R]|uniref:helix-turn-helix domain-containing protein n=1 Tax=Halorubrum sp. Atlit-8R TaxID=2282126 RepID=UPI003742A726
MSKLRDAHKESQTEFAEQIGENTSTPSRWESGKIPPNGENIDTIRDVIPDDLDPADVVDTPKLSRDWDGRLSSIEY